MKRRIISLLMALMLVFTLLPVGALADAADQGDIGNVDMDKIIAAVEDIINGGGSSADLGSILEGLDYNQLAQLVAALIKDKVDIGPVLEKIDVNELVGVVKGLIDGDTDLGSVIENLDTDKLVALVTDLVGDNETLAPILEKVDVDKLVAVVKDLLAGDQDISSVIENLDTDKLVALVTALIGDNETLAPILEKVDVDKLVTVIKALIAGDQDISSIIENLDTDKLVALITALIGDDETLGPILDKLDIDQLVTVIKALIAGDVDISSIIENLDTDKLVALVTALIGDNETLAPILEKVDVDKLVTVIKALIAGDQDISSIIENLDTDKLVALITALIGDDETLGPILDKLDIDQLVTVIKALIAGDVDISSIIAQLDPYEILKVISGLIGSELDVVGPNNVTVTETEDAVFKVKVNLSLADQLKGTTYKYMWLEPSELKNLNDINFENLDVLSLILRIGGKSLGNGDTFTVQNTSMRDDGRKFVCVIYNVSEKVFYVTDEATLTVTPFSDCTHNTLRNVRGLEPSCTEAGHIAYYECATCGKLFLDKECITQTNRNDIVIPATGHTPVAGKAAVEPTCTEAGLTAEIVCSVCGEVLVAQETVPATGHTKVVDVEAKEPGCTEAGCTEGSHCGVCGEVLAVSETVPSKGHSFDGIQCTVCGEYVPFPFKDVPEGYWCRSEVDYVWKHNLMKGITNDTFAPNASMTRAMFATVLYRMKDCPSVEGLSEPFTDVDENYWAYDAIVWAYNVGVTTGVTATTFEPGMNITRAQLVTMMYRYENSPAVSGVLTFTDSADIAVPYRAAVLWATRNGIVNGYENGSFRPNGTASRGHMAAILARYCQM